MDRPIVLFAALVAAAAAFLEILQPETWAPFFRAELARKTRRAGTLTGLVIGLLGQAATTAGVGLLVTILVLSMVAAADAATHVWAGVAVAILSLVFFVRFLRHDRAGWKTAAQLIAAISAGAPGANDPYGKLEGSPAQIVRAAIFSPRFVLAPMFLAASASGQAGIGNAWPVVIAYAVVSVAAVLWLARLIRNGSTGGPLEFLAARTNLFVGIAVGALGVGTALAG